MYRVFTNGNCNKSSILPYHTQLNNSKPIPNMLRPFNVILLLLFAVSCATVPKPSLKESLTGTWTTDKIRVKMISVNGTDKDSTAIVGSEDFQELLGIHSNVGKYYANGTYEEIYYATEDSILLTLTGNWITLGKDSMKLYQKTPVTDIHLYKVKLKKNRGIFTGLVDWDGDGADDDEFTSIGTRTIE